MSNVKVSTTFSGYIPGLGQGPINNPIIIARRELERAIAMGYKRHIRLHTDEVVEVKPEVVEKPVEVPVVVEDTAKEAMAKVEELSASVKEKMVKVTIGGVVKEVTVSEAKALREKSMAKKAAMTKKK